VTAERHKQNSDKILTVLHCDTRIPDTRGETQDGEGPTVDRAGDAGMGGANGNDRDGAGTR